MSTNKTKESVKKVVASAFAGVATACVLLAICIWAQEQTTHPSDPNEWTVCAAPASLKGPPNASIMGCPAQMFD